MITDDCLRSIINAADAEDADDVAIRYMLVEALRDTDIDLAALTVVEPMHLGNTPRQRRMRKSGWLRSSEIDPPE